MAHLYKHRRCSQSLVASRLGIVRFLSRVLLPSCVLISGLRARNPFLDSVVSDRPAIELDRV